MSIRITISVLCLFLTSQVQAQQTFNPNNVLVISKEGAKRPGLMRSGSRVTCKLKNGEKIKGEILIYSDHILIESTKVNFHEIVMLKPNNWNRWKRQASSMAGGALKRRALGNKTLNTAYWVQTGVLTALNFTLLERKFITAQGWEFQVQEFQIPSFARRG